MSFKFQNNHSILDILLIFHVEENFSFNVERYHFSKTHLVMLISEQASKDSCLLLLKNKLNRKVESIHVSDSDKILLIVVEILNCIEMEFDYICYTFIAEFNVFDKEGTNHYLKNNFSCIRNLRPNLFKTSFSLITHSVSDCFPTFETLKPPLFKEIAFGYFSHIFPFLFAHVHFSVEVKVENF